MTPPQPHPQQQPSTGSDVNKECLTTNNQTKMNAKKSIKRAEARYFHINNDFNREAQMSNFVTNMCSYDDPDYNWINEHNQRQHDLVQYLNDLSGKAESELYHLRNLPWYRKLWIA